MDYVDQLESVIIRKANEFEHSVKLTNSEINFLSTTGIDGNYDPGCVFIYLASIDVIKRELKKAGTDSLERRKELQSELRFSERIMQNVYRVLAQLDSSSRLAVFTKEILNHNIDH